MKTKLKKLKVKNRKAFAKLTRIIKSKKVKSKERNITKKELQSFLDWFNKRDILLDKESRCRINLEIE